MRMRSPFVLALLWPGLGQLKAARRRLGLFLGLAAVPLSMRALWAEPDFGISAASASSWAESAALGWLALWAWGLIDLACVLVLAPARRARADRLLRAGVGYLLRGDSARARIALERSVFLARSPAASLYLAEAERRDGRGGRASRRLAALLRAGWASAWRWEIGLAQVSA